ncbi:Dynamin-related GTPase protein, partial [Marasmius crinis-equi]
MDSDLIKLVNKLQDTFHNLGGELDMPQLVVVGSQSAGKSSVLETIVGKDFLPRGQGIVTRRPLVLQLIHTPAPSEANGQPTEWGQFLHLDKRFTDYAEIRKEIEQETFRVAGQNKGISKLPISLRIYSPNVLDLTLVDLPGLTKIPVGDQPSDIERQIRNLVVEYISNPNSVILAVSPANVDLANSESLKLARSVDPQGRRTIGVLTKLDLMDAGTNAADILTGRVYPLKLGFIGIVNRSQQDINSEKSMGAALDSETEFFKNHPAYRNIAHKNGTRYLAKTLNQVLMNHIREKLPDMKARLNTLISQAQQELSSFGDTALLNDKNSQGALILRLMTQFARDFVSSIDGTNVDISTKELSGGARIYYIFNDVFGSALHSIDVEANLDDQDIRTAIRNSTGPRPSLFVPEVAFEMLVKPQIKTLEKPSLRCVELVYEELVKICHNCTNEELQRFPALHAKLVEVVSELLRERLGPTSEYTQSLIDIQAAYINTNHPAFVAGSGNALAASTVAAKNQKPPVKPEQSSSSSTSIATVASTSTATSTATTATARVPSITRPTSDDSADDTDSGVSGIFPPRDSRTSRASIGTTNPRSISRSRQPPVASLGVGAPPGSSPRETFLNYFFGAGVEEKKALGGGEMSMASSGAFDMK